MPFDTHRSVSIPQMNLPWIDSPFFETLLELSNHDAETKRLIKHYADCGYLIIDPEIPDFNRQADKVIEGLASYYRGSTRIQDAWLFNDAVKAIATAPKVLALLNILYQREPIPFQTLNFSVGSQQRTHSDTIHFHSVPARFMCGVWVALEDVDSYNGPLHYYPGSHKVPIFDFQDLGLSSGHQNYFIYENFIKYLILFLKIKKIEVCLRKGQAIIWAANLLHGGSPILDFSRTRHTQVTHYFFSDCMYYVPMLSNARQKTLHKTINICTKELASQFCNGQQICGSKGFIDFITDPITKLRMTSPLIAKALYNFDDWKQKLRRV